MTIGRVYADATEALVIDAGGGVLKLHLPGSAAREEIRALELAGGDGRVALLHHAHRRVCEGGESYRLAQATRGHGVTPLTTSS